MLLEKPLCRTLAEADALVAAAAAHGSATAVRREPGLRAGRAAHCSPGSPQLGPLTHLEVRSLQGLPTWGDFTVDEWGGGALFDLGVHPLAVASAAAPTPPAGPPTSVAATLRGGEGHGSDEHAEVQLTFRSGLVGTVVSSWQNEDGQIWDVQLSSATGVVRAEFWPRPTLERNGEPVPLPANDSPLTFIDEMGYTGQLRAFADDVAAGSTPLMDVAFGRLILDIVCAAYWSAGHGSAPEPVPFSGPRDKTPLQLWHGL